MRAATVLLLLAAGFVKSNAQTIWVPDKAHSEVKFAVSHLVIAEVTGRFKDFTYTLEQINDDFSASKLSATIKTASIDTENENRDKHLRSDDFLNAEKYPDITFESTLFKKVSGNSYRIHGNLTIRDVTMPVILETVYNGTVKDPRGNIKVGFKATTTLDRFDFGVKWNAAIETGGLVAGSEVSITILIEAQKKNSG